jgi:predicted nucleic acid-binding protein
MTVYALDTNIVSHFLRKDKTIQNKIRSIPKKGDQLDIPPIVFYEIRRGLLSIKAPVKTTAFKKLCLAYPVKLIEPELMETAASIYTQLQKKGRIIEDADILIAAHCIRHGFTLVTNNTKHFGNIANLNLVDWTT